MDIGAFLSKSFFGSWGFALLFPFWILGVQASEWDETVQLLARIQEERPHQNFVFSPYALRMGLGMASLGAKEETRKQLGTARKPFIGSSAQVGPGSSPVSGGSELWMANRLWLQYGATLTPSFIAASEKTFDIRPWILNFAEAPDLARDRINGWVTEKTNSRVKTFLSDETFQTPPKMLLSSVFLMKSAWIKPFELARSEENEFFSEGGEKSKAVYMHSKAPYAYLSSDQMQILDLPYSDKDLMIRVVVPGGHSLPKHALAGVFSKTLIETELSLAFPRVHAESQLNLKDALKEWGIVAPLQPELADFSGMTGTRDLYLSQVVQTTRVHLSEEGSEFNFRSLPARSAGRKLAAHPQSHEVKVNRPFYFFVWHRPSKTTLIAGRIVKP